MKLSNTEIRKALAKGYLIIEPAPRPQDISATGVDLRLGPVLYVLERGKTYQYLLRAELVRNGQRVVKTQKVIVRAGERTRASIEFGAERVARK